MGIYFSSNYFRNVFLELDLYPILKGLKKSFEYFFYYIKVMIIIKTGLKTFLTDNLQMGLPFWRYEFYTLIFKICVKMGLKMSTIDCPLIES